ncbi:hypothetical protein [Nonomuraea sp. 10N515B]|uniref:hypothetical protein n=1 Tax=Nonomuraea sp. 10N515B TaxID=3457422 RepID=UPI003FCC54FF
MHGEQEAQRAADVADRAGRPAVLFAVIERDGFDGPGELDDRRLGHGRRGDSGEVAGAVEQEHLTVRYWHDRPREWASAASGSDGLVSSWRRSSFWRCEKRQAVFHGAQEELVSAHDSFGAPWVGGVAGQGAGPAIAQPAAILLVERTDGAAV